MGGVDVVGGTVVQSIGNLGPKVPQGCRDGEVCYILEHDVFLFEYGNVDVQILLILVVQSEFQEKGCFTVMAKHHVIVKERELNVAPEYLGGYSGGREVLLRGTSTCHMDNSFAKHTAEDTWPGAGDLA